ncbi:hypothetical protein D915_003966 [Fasciola hepatica]|uniref:Uncharacterized protein n=1 Tax=Fasciola hepatica TaxID=6192 RepID=A0A4E0R9I8_FASHE|nr:hypothetical protein D915_003966 [Fasciola hepatica]
MVVFVCGHCNESLRKNAVESHFLRCRGCSSVSCIDCQLHFDKSSYRTHCSCISEAQKYDKNRSDLKRSGPSKQEKWTEMVRQVIKSCGVDDPQTRFVLRELENCPNLPRKKRKFENFMVSKYRNISPQKIEDVWGIISKCFEKEKSDPGEAKRMRVDKETKSTDFVTASDAEKHIKAAGGSINLRVLTVQLLTEYSSGGWSGSKKIIRSALKEWIRSAKHLVSYSPEDKLISLKHDITNNHCDENNADAGALQDNSQCVLSLSGLIYSVLNNVDDHQLSLKKLRKRLTKLYNSSSLAVKKPLTEEELQARLDRKLKKSNLFHLDEDGKTVRLTTSS